MSTAVGDTFDFRGPDPRGFGRFVAWSVGVHVALLAIAFVPGLWHARKTEPSVMTINLGGSVGPRSGGIADLGGRPVEKVAPPPKRPEPIPPAASKPAPNVTTKTPVKPPEVKPVEPTAPPAPVTHPPATGRAVAAGSSAVDTGVTGQGTGLAQGGGAGSMATVEDNSFCCKPYLNLVSNLIRDHDIWSQPDRGQTIVKIELHRNGTFPLPTVKTSSGNGSLDRLALSAVRSTKLPPLPDEYVGDTLTVFLTFDFRGSS